MEDALITMFQFCIENVVMMYVKNEEYLLQVYYFQNAEVVICWHEKDKMS